MYAFSVGYANCILGVMYTCLHIHSLYKAKGHTHSNAHTQAYTLAEGTLLSRGIGGGTITLRLTIVRRSMAACRCPDISGY